MIRPLLTLLAAEVTAALSGQASPARQWAKRWLEEHGIDVLVGVSEWLVPEPMPGVVSARPRAQCDDGQRGSHGSISGHVFRRPCCAMCGARVELTVSGTDTHTGEVVFSCDDCEAAEVVTFDPMVEDAVVAEWLGYVRAFVGGEPS